MKTKIVIVAIIEEYNTRTDTWEDVTEEVLKVPEPNPTPSPDKMTSSFFDPFGAFVLQPLPFLQCLFGDLVLFFLVFLAPLLVGDLVLPLFPFPFGDLVLVMRPSPLPQPFCPPFEPLPLSTLYIYGALVESLDVTTASSILLFTLLIFTS